jgi:hypothetical protein
MPPGGSRYAHEGLVAVRVRTILRFFQRAPEPALLAESPCLHTSPKYSAHISKVQRFRPAATRRESIDVGRSVRHRRV